MHWCQQVCTPPHVARVGLHAKVKRPFRKRPFRDPPRGRPDFLIVFSLDDVFFQGLFAVGGKGIFKMFANTNVFKDVQPSGPHPQHRDGLGGSSSAGSHHTPPRQSHPTPRHPHSHPTHAPSLAQPNCKSALSDARLAPSHHCIKVACDQATSGYPWLSYGWGPRKKTNHGPTRRVGRPAGDQFSPP